MPHPWALSRPLSLSHTQVENLCRERALKAFGLDAAQWGVNVQVRCFSLSSAQPPLLTAPQLMCAALLWLSCEFRGLHGAAEPA
jgi:Serine hydroxymethyltransferase